MSEVLHHYNMPGKASPGLFLVRDVLGQANTRPVIAVQERRVPVAWKANDFHLTHTYVHAKMKLTEVEELTSNS